MDLEEARSVLVHHSKSSKNGCFPPNTDRVGRLLNPLCGDQVEFRVRIEDGYLQAVGFSTQACAICSASASLLTETVAGCAIEDIKHLRSEFEKAVTESEETPWPARLLAFVSFAHLRVNPRRRACAILPWIALSQTFEVNGCRRPQPL